MRPPRALAPAVCSLLLGGALLAAGCARPDGEGSTAGSPQPASPARGANLILISIDTLRADRLGAYGYPRPTSPAMDRLAARGVRFAGAVAESSWTLPSHLTLFTGLYPSSHGVTVETERLSADVPVLTELLSAAGYRTFGTSAGGLLGAEYGFGRGFEHYDDHYKLLGRALEQTRRQIEGLAPGERYFAFVHTYDVHCPYDPPAQYAEAFRTRPPEDYLETAGRCGNPHFNHMSLSAGQARFLSDQYDAGIRAADDQLAGFFAFLDQRDAWRDTVVVLLSDHGEELMEHGKVGHERTLYIESLRVPLLIAAPGVAPRVVEGGVGLVDVAPTVLALLGLPAPQRMQGRSLLPALLGAGQDLAAPRFSELDRHVRLRSVVDASHHLILDLDASRQLLFDLDADPTEQRDLAAGEAQRARRLTGSIVRHFKALPTPPEVPEHELSPEKLEQLRALGYLDG